MNRHDPDNDISLAAVQKLTQSLQRLDRQIKILYEDRLDGRISSEVYDQKFKEKTVEREEIAKNIKRISSENTEYMSVRLIFLNLLRTLRRSSAPNP